MVTVQEFAVALAETELNAGQILMLRAHFTAPEYKITSNQLASAAGYKGYQAANLWYGKLGKALGQYLNAPPQEKFADGVTPIWTFVIAWGQRIGQGKEWEWTLRPELVAAIRLVGLFS